MLRLLLISDTHVPARARTLPDEVWQAVDEADVVIHAGDWVSLSMLDQLAERSNRLVAVYGNNDGPELRARLPEVAHVVLDGVRFAVVHETGSKIGREQRAERAFPAVDVLVFGHSHIPWDTLSPAGTRLLNPGSCTDRRREPFRTYMTAVIDDGRVTAALHQIPAHS